MPTVQVRKSTHSAQKAAQKTRRTPDERTASRKESLLNSML